MPNRKKFNARFPPARIKKIMRTDKEVGKVAAPVPAVISRALELFAQHLLQQAGDVTVTRGSRTLSPAHLKQCIQSERRFDFLKDLVAAVPDAAESQQEVGDARSPEQPGPAPAPCATPDRDPDESEPRRKYLKTESSCVSASSANGAHPYSAPVSDRPPVPDLIHASQLRLSGGHISADSRLGFPAPAVAHMPFPGAGLLAYPDGLFASPTPPPAHQGSAPALAVSYGSLPDTNAGDTL